MIAIDGVLQNSMVGIRTTTYDQSMKGIHEDKIQQLIIFVYSDKQSNVDILVPDKSSTMVNWLNSITRQWTQLFNTTVASIGHYFNTYA